MRSIILAAIILTAILLPACNPETDLQNRQAAATSHEAANGELKSPSTSTDVGQLVEPPPGSSGIPVNLARLVVKFAEPVRAVAAAPFSLQGSGAGPISLSLGEPLPCQGSCYLLLPAGALAPSTELGLVLLPNTLQFLDGKPLPAGTFGAFSTSSEADLFAPRILAFTAEMVAGCVVAHVVADETSRVEITADTGDGELSLPGGGLGKTLDFARPLQTRSANQKVQVVAKVTDLAGNTVLSSPVALEMGPGLPPLVMTEILANPAGSETTQEWVEIYNRGSEPVALGGLILADKTGGDVLPEASLGAGAYALIVPEKYDPALALDTPPREGTLLLRVSGRLGSDGLGNAGETVRLRTSGGQIVSQYGGWVDVSASAWSGKTTKRSGFDACDAPGEWSTIPGSATPGW